MKLSLSILVLDSRDRHGNLWLPQNASTEQPYNNIFLQNTAITSIGMMPLLLVLF